MWERSICTNKRTGDEIIGASAGCYLEPRSPAGTSIIHQNRNVSDAHTNTHTPTCLSPGETWRSGLRSHQRRRCLVTCSVRRGWKGRTQAAADYFIKSHSCVEHEEWSERVGGRCVGCDCPMTISVIFKPHTHTQGIQANANVFIFIYVYAVSMTGDVWNDQTLLGDSDIRKIRASLRQQLAAVWLCWV